MVFIQRLKVPRFYLSPLWLAPRGGMTPENRMAFEQGVAARFHCCSQLVGIH
ncbi:hypothetical protein H9K76_19415 [Diaphorobacter ruginosibacter]|uniref:Uncharacterized protein n=1 Tax=Diaphorobacter ruginosibacter TaxID=1715720 RepID=A0A7G9RM40_9BURK|nr:hypothetical protein [Diaphorobacter ruginosibacter]QNN56665.1 hypothetical protein H9K76_19415 [Diaphorobacter ruginosibacter]